MTTTITKMEALRKDLEDRYTTLIAEADAAALPALLAARERMRESTDRAMAVDRLCAEVLA